MTITAVYNARLEVHLTLFFSGLQVQGQLPTPAYGYGNKRVKLIIHNYVYNSFSVKFKTSFMIQLNILKIWS